LEIALTGKLADMVVKLKPETESRLRELAETTGRAQTISSRTQWRGLSQSYPKCVVLHPDALADLNEIWEFIAADNLSAADGVLEEIHEAMRGLAPFPQLAGLYFLAPSSVFCGRVTPSE
jgi:ParE toxin of type II toxin-antitoxin system, parDE